MNAPLNNPLRILHLALGGTIDADPALTHYIMDTDGIEKTLVTVTPLFPSVRRIAEMGISTSHIIANKDSKLLDANDLERVVEFIRTASPNDIDRIVITMGTDCMTAVGVHIKESLPVLSIPVIITGAMIPLLSGPESDGFANLHAACTHTVTSSGVYICMGDVFENPGSVKKDYTRLCFEKIEG